MSAQYTWPDVLSQLVAGRDLSAEQATWAMTEILEGNTSPVRVAGFAVALRAKGETVVELEALANVMLSLTNQVEISGVAVDVVGTGGDRANTVNISTMASVVAAAAGARVVKHGNRSASSQCGTADVLEAVGLNLTVPAEKQQQVMDSAGLVFLFAPMYHSSLKHAAGPRRELGISTTFNFLGPLANPARPRAQAIGVADRAMAPLVAGVLARRGNQGLVFHGGDGLDELTTTTDSLVWLIADGDVVETTLDPRELGLARTTPQSLVGGPPEVNARILRETFAGATGPVRDIVVLNGAAALLAHDKPDLRTSLTEQLRERVDRVATALDSGAAAERLDRWVAATQAA